MPTVPIPRLPAVDTRHPIPPQPTEPSTPPPDPAGPRHVPGNAAGPYPPPRAAADPGHQPPVGSEPEHLPPRPADYSAAPPDTAAPGYLAPGAGEPPPNARYEGDWADWMMSSDSYPPRPGGDTAEQNPPGTDSAPWGDESPVDDVRAGEGPGVPIGQEPDSNPATVPSTARERLRARLTPREGSAPIPVTARTANTPGRNRPVPILLGLAGLAALGAAAYVQFAVVGAGEPGPAPTAANPPAAAAGDISSAADPHCPAERIGNTIQGNGPGGTGSGTDAIFGFQHAYYVTRSGEQARTVVAADAAVPPAADIQRGVDTIPPGTTHCLRITPGAFVGQYTVVVTEHRPGSAPLEYNPQLVTTMRIGDRTLITGIGPMP